MEYGDFKDLPRRAASNKVLHDKAFEIASNTKYDGYQRRFTSMFYKRFDKKAKELVFVQGQESLRIKNRPINYINLSPENSKVQNMRSF